MFQGEIQCVFRRAYQSAGGVTTVIASWEYDAHVMCVFVAKVWTRNELAEKKMSVEVVRHIYKAHARAAFILRGEKAEKGEHGFH